jgi:aspartate/methionine/tyrosine aminotransferase
MQFAKLRSGAKYHLASSGIMNYSLRGLPVTIEQLEITGTDYYGHQPLKDRLAKMNGVTAQHVVTAAGTSMANYLALAGTLEPGEEALIEWPTYELITSTAEYVGAKVRFFERRMESDFRLEPEAVERAMTPQTRLIVLTNLHNPSGVLMDEPELRAVGDIAAAHNARVLVDEVYLEALYDQRPRSAIHLGDHFLVTSSLTKGYGLSGLRCGWILAAPELAQRIWYINDLHGVNAAHTAELLSVIALDHLDHVIARAKELIAANRPALDAFLDSRSDLASVRPKFGTIAFPKLLRGSVDHLDRLLREKYETSIVPGKYFGMPQHFRIGIGGDPEMTREALNRLGQALDDLA